MNGRRHPRDYSELLARLDAIDRWLVPVIAIILMALMPWLAPHVIGEERMQTRIEAVSHVR